MNIQSLLAMNIVSVTVRCDCCSTPDPDFATGPQSVRDEIMTSKALWTGVKEYVFPSDNHRPIHTITQSQSLYSVTYLRYDIVVSNLTCPNMEYDQIDLKLFGGITRHVLGLRHKSLTLVLVLIFTAGDIKTRHLDLTLLTLIVGVAFDTTLLYCWWCLTSVSKWTHK